MRCETGGGGTSSAAPCGCGSFWNAGPALEVCTPARHRKSRILIKSSWIPGPHSAGQRWHRLHTAGGDCTKEHPNDRADGVRQDGDRAAAGKAHGRALRQGGLLTPVPLCTPTRCHVRSATALLIMQGMLQGSQKPPSFLPCQYPGNSASNRACQPPSSILSAGFQIHPLT